MEFCRLRAGLFSSKAGFLENMQAFSKEIRTFVAEI